MSTKARATINDLYNVPGKAELVNGEIVTMSPSGPDHGRAAFKIGTSLYEYELRTGLGHMAPDNVGFKVDLPHRETIAPDVCFYQGPLGMKFVSGAPMFAVEVRSEGDYGPAAEREMTKKRADYFAAGTQVVWDVDLLGADAVRVYRKEAPEQPTVYRRGDIAEAEPALPGWSMPVDDLYW
jgi:Uma2 family endonuclease